MDKIRFKVSIIIPNYNGQEHLKRLLPSIANQNFDDYEVLIIDDCSPDRSVLDYIKSFIKDYRNFNLVENNENLGFVKTCNKGIGLSRGDYICLLNNDTEVKSNFVQRNVEILDADSSIGVLSCIIVDKHGKNWFSGGSFKSGLNVNLVDDFQGVRSVDFVAGTACFYRKEVFEKIGLLNEFFVMYHEDVEFCLKVKNRTNYKVCMFAEKLVKHYGESSSLMGTQIPYYLHRNQIILLRKYYPKSIPRALLFYLREISNLAVVSVLKRRPGYFLSTRYIIRGILEGFIRREK